MPRERSMILRWASLIYLAVGSRSTPLPENQFRTLSYDVIVTQLHDLATNYPHLARVRRCVHLFNLFNVLNGGPIARSYAVSLYV